MVQFEKILLAILYLGYIIILDYKVLYSFF